MVNIFLLLPPIAFSMVFIHEKSVMYNHQKTLRTLVSMKTRMSWSNRRLPHSRRNAVIDGDLISYLGVRPPKLSKLCVLYVLSKRSCSQILTSRPAETKGRADPIRSNLVTDHLSDVSQIQMHTKI